MKEANYSWVCEYRQAIVIDEDKLVIVPPDSKLHLLPPNIPGGPPRLSRTPNHGYISTIYNRQDVYPDLPNMRLTVNAGCALCTLFTRDFDYKGPLAQNSQEQVDRDGAFVTAKVSFSVIPISSTEHSGDDDYYLTVRKSPDHRISSVEMCLERQSDGKTMAVAKLEL
jgi:hypothetical protein